MGTATDRDRANRLRPVLVVVAMILPVSILGGLAWTLSRSDQHRTEPAAIGEPERFCDVVALERYERRVANVRETRGSTTLEQDVLIVTVGFIRRSARLDDTPPALRHRIRELAGELEAAGPDGDLSRATELARSLDRAAITRCQEEASHAGS